MKTNVETFNKDQFFARWRVEQIGTPGHCTWAVVHRILRKERVESIVDRHFKTQALAEKWLGIRFRQARNAFLRDLADRHWQARPSLPTLWDKEDDYVL